jgi:hypothetical protein
MADLHELIIRHGREAAREMGPLAASVRKFTVRV